MVQLEYSIKPNERHVVVSTRPHRFRENGSRPYSAIFVDRLRRARYYISAMSKIAGFTQLSVYAGTAAHPIEHLKADIAIYPSLPTLGTAPSRVLGEVLGEIKLSWKWNPSMAHSANHEHQQEYLQGHSQIKYYMTRHNARCGFILTDQS